MPYLIVNAENGGYQIYHFLKRIRIGRHADCDINLTATAGQTISRCHAYIQGDDQTFDLVDCSLNGTFFGGDLISTHRLKHGDRFLIGDYAITFFDDSIVQVQSGNRMTETDARGESNQYENTVKVKRSEPIEEGVSDTSLKKKLEEIGIVAEDKRMLALFKEIVAVCRINVPILIMGEPGTGKEKVAQAIHEFSRAQGHFVAVNCSAIPEDIFENELFGSIKGAFSDATNKSGKLEMADNGTLFLDEIGDMGKRSQPKLLRFLETRMLSRLGETRIRKLDIRVVAATNQDLNQMIRTSRFRPDLFQRLACIKLHIPPLRKRPNDILPLANFFLADFAHQYNLKPLRISNRAAKILQTYHWPGNVRELSNIMLNLMVRTKSAHITPSDLAVASEALARLTANTIAEIIPLKSLEKHHIFKALKHTGNNKTRACAMLGISKDTLYRKLKRYNG